MKALAEAEMAQSTPESGSPWGQSLSPWLRQGGQPGAPQVLQRPRNGEAWKQKDLCPRRPAIGWETALPAPLKP